MGSLQLQSHACGMHESGVMEGRDGLGPHSRG